MNSMLLNWTVIPSQAAHGVVVGYKIFYRPYYSNQAFTVVQTNASTFNIKLNNLQETTPYAIMATGITSKGEGLQRFLSASTCKYSLSLSLSLFPPPSLPYSFAPSSPPLSPLYLYLYLYLSVSVFTNKKATEWGYGVGEIDLLHKGRARFWFTYLLLGLFLFSFFMVSGKQPFFFIG